LKQRIDDDTPVRAQRTALSESVSSYLNSRYACEIRLVETRKAALNNIHVEMEELLTVFRNYRGRRIDIGVSVDIVRQASDTQSKVDSPYTTLNKGGRIQDGTLYIDVFMDVKGPFMPERNRQRLVRVKVSHFDITRGLFKEVSFVGQYTQSLEFDDYHLESKCETKDSPLLTLARMLTS
jgi:hypothetical protein